MTDPLQITDEISRFEGVASSVLNTFFFSDFNDNELCYPSAAEALFVFVNRNS
jgi:hypothetical protein